MPRTPLILCMLLLAVPSAARTEDDFRDRVAPILQRHCLSCHNSVDRAGDFSLQTAADLRLSGYVEPGNPDDSELLIAVSGTETDAPRMPKDAAPLSAADRRALSEWIRSGAAWPDGLRLSAPAVQDFDWWSLQPLQQPAVPEFPAAADQRWVRTPVDAFVLEQLRRHGLTPSPEADRRTLIRRLTYDLTGLPPTPDEIHRFLQDQRPDAWERLVDRLLSSPHYGERWAQHWLDVARYADTCGYDKDKLRPHAWPYRDYVVRSFNADKPYARFVEEQIAGDVLYPNSPDGTVGLGFLAAGPWDFIGHVEVPESKLDGQEARNLDRDEMVSATLNTFCSATIQCARCHNHKFDPFTQQHYYGLQAVFSAVDRADRPYEPDAQTARLRRQLTTRLNDVRAELKSLDDSVRAAGGTELAQLTARIAELGKQQDSAGRRPPEHGYHSAVSDHASDEKWVQIDLGKAVAVHQIVLRPCYDDFNNIGAGFGFPLRFDVRASLTADMTAATLLLDHTKSNFPNPGLSPVRATVGAAPFQARYIRITAHRLAERQSDYIFALGEVEVLAADGRSVARGAAVTAADSIEAPPRWRRDNLVDGLWAEAANAAAAEQLARLRSRQASLLGRIRTADQQRRIEALTDEARQLESRLARLPAPQMVYAAATEFRAQGNFKPTLGKPRRVQVLHRGNISQPLADASPGTIPLRPNTDPRFPLSPDDTEGQRRAALAHWITRRDNPLTWRSIANRIWQYHIGRGLVATPNDFGRMGQTPTHPQLLDWLACEFRDRGQKFRALHRLIVLSSTYRQVSDYDEASARIDSDNQFLWRMNGRRLEAEELRDSVLAVSGRMDPAMGGPGYFLFRLEKAEHSPHYEYHKFNVDDPATHRRTLYRFVVRSQPDPFMTTLDCADSSQSTPQRAETLTSLQALSLLNNRFMLSMSAHFADRRRR